VIQNSQRHQLGSGLFHSLRSSSHTCPVVSTFSPGASRRVVNIFRNTPQATMLATVMTPM
jgi:hypothetical protein